MIFDFRKEFWNCACVQGPCPVHDPITPAEDLYAMVAMLRKKLQPVTLTPMGEVCVDPDSYIL